MRKALFGTGLMWAVYVFQSVVCVVLQVWHWSVGLIQAGVPLLLVLGVLAFICRPVVPSTWSSALSRVVYGSVDPREGACRSVTARARDCRLLQGELDSLCGAVRLVRASLDSLNRGSELLNLDVPHVNENTLHIITCWRPSCSTALHTAPNHSSELTLVCELRTVANLSLIHI